jgi:hypothetical protein
MEEFAEHRKRVRFARGTPVKPVGIRLLYRDAFLLELACQLTGKAHGEIVQTALEPYLRGAEQTILSQEGGAAHLEELWIRWQSEQSPERLTP